jgi:hypothetical protein
MNCGTMFCHIVAIVLFVWGLVVSKLSSTFSVAEPMVFHVHCFQLLDNIVVDNTKCSGVVCLHWGQRLGMAHEFEGMVGGNGFSAADVECPHLSLCCQEHDRLDNLCNCEDGAIVWWFGCVARHEEMSARLAVCLCFGEVRCVALSRKYNVTHMVHDDCIRMSSGIV